MKKHFLIIALLGMSVSLFAQDELAGFSTSATGVKYKIEKSAPTNQIVKLGDVVIGHFAIYYGDSLTYSTFSKPSMPIFAVDKRSNMFKGDLMDALVLMHKGETATFAFQKDSMLKVQSQIPSFKGNYIFYKVEVDSLTTMAAMDKERQEKALAERHLADSLHALEGGIIAKYLNDNSWDTTKYDGVYVKRLKDGSGMKAARADNVKINYTGRLLSGRVFDTSIDSVAKTNGLYQQGRKYEPLGFQIGAHQMIAGFEAAAQQMRKGDIIEVLIPSDLAYGSRAIGIIPPSSPLVFTMEMVDFEKGKPLTEQPVINLTPNNVKTTGTTKPTKKSAVKGKSKSKKK